jgi:hypothetical protein
VTRTVVTAVSAIRETLWTLVGLVGAFFLVDITFVPWAIEFTVVVFTSSVYVTALNFAL